MARLVRCDCGWTFEGEDDDLDADVPADDVHLVRDREVAPDHAAGSAG